MSVKKMTVLSLYTAVALILFVVESVIPMPVPLPFVKLGLANIITLIVLVCYSGADAPDISGIRVLRADCLSGLQHGWRNSLFFGRCGYKPAVKRKVYLYYCCFWCIIS